MMPLEIKRRRNSSSSLLGFGFQTQQQILATCLTKGSSAKVLVTLKQVWKAARAKVRRVAEGTTAVFSGSKPTKPQAKRTKILKMHSTQMTPKTLKNRWPKAARRASVLAVRATRLAVSVVPMFSPITSAMPR